MVVNAETWTYDDMGFAADGTFNSDPGDDLTVVDAEHPIMEGFKGDITVSKPAIARMTCSGSEADDDGWELIHRSILYALGQIPFDVAPEDNLAVTWGQIKAVR